MLKETFHSGYKECVLLDKNSKEYKEYEMLHTPIVVDNEVINDKIFCIECGIKLNDDRRCRNVNCSLDDLLQ